MSGRIATATRPPLLVIIRRIPFPALLLFRSVGTRPDNDDPTPIRSQSQDKKKKQHHDHRLASVINAVNDRKLPPELRSRPNSIRSQLTVHFVGQGTKHLSETDIVNVVEQRIWRSMEDGHFENLPGKGKPLDLNTNPHADPAEDTLHRILSKNGCAPEWVELNKEIRCKIAEWRLALKKAWTSRINHQDSTWLKDSVSLKAQMRDINNKVLHYNLIVPFGRQMFGLKWDKEITKLE